MALFIPWALVFSIGMLDWGFYSYAMISATNAARVAASYTSSDGSTQSDSAGACSYALDELRKQTNVSASLSTCSAAPVVVTVSNDNGPDGSAASAVTVRYTTATFFRLPGLLSSPDTVVSTVRMRVRY
jgi:hypothetical protein